MSIKQKVKNNPQLKKMILAFIFRPKPNSAKVRRWLWLLTIFPRYLQRGISWGARLDLVPFNRFRFGKKSIMEKNSVINNGMGTVAVGADVHIGYGSIIIGPVDLRDHVTLSPYVRILGMQHGLEVDVPHHYQPCYATPVIIDEYTFVEPGTVIIGKKNGEPLHIGRSVRIGANSVVIRDIPAYSLVEGNPAKVVRIWDVEQKKWIPTDENKLVETEEKIKQIIH
ncbi:hypothetical protein JW960_27650 [candidate division KSB1 bacterium]|nr:hypothetical protein [candidate division KSB1 bacterium]